MIHTGLQIDPNASVRLRKGRDNEVEIVFCDTYGDASAVVRVSPETLEQIRTGEIHER
jgi:hypothetical protein